MEKETDEKKSEGGSLSIKDVIHLQADLEKDIDFDKPDSELTPEQMAKKIIYQTLDKTVEESIGAESKKTIDDARRMMSTLGKIQDSIDKVSKLGQEIEKNLVLQYAFLTSHFDKSDENQYYTTTRKLTDAAVNADVQLSNEQRIEIAQKVLEMVKIYRGVMMKEIKGKQEIASALLLSFEDAVSKIDFETSGTEIDNYKGAEQMKKNLHEWLELTKELLSERAKAVAAVEQDLEIDEILPNHIIESSGDITQNVSAVEIKTKGERMLRLVNEAHTAENDMLAKRSRISEELFGKLDDYMEIPKPVSDTSSGTKTPGVRPKGFYSISGGQFTALWIFAVIGWLWAISSSSDYDPSPFAGFMVWAIPFAIIFYTIGWTNARKG